MGLKFEEENEEDLKDMLNFAQPYQVAPVLGNWVEANNSGWAPNTRNRKQLELCAKKNIAISFD